MAHGGRRPGSGRPKGSKNKIKHRTIDDLVDAVEELGGHKALVAWVRADKANERDFWLRLYPLTQPKEPLVKVSSEKMKVTFGG